MTAASLFWGLLFGSVGLAFFVYGKKQRSAMPLLCGIALMVVPYFVPSTTWLVVAGVALVVLPYFVRP